MPLSPFCLLISFLPLHYVRDNILFTSHSAIQHSAKLARTGQNGPRHEMEELELERFFRMQLFNALYFQ